jgi:hypothetical protein
MTREDPARQTSQPHPAQILGGRRRASVRIVLGIGCPSFHTPSRGERIRESTTKLHPPFLSPRFSRNRERAD